VSAIAAFLALVFVLAMVALLAEPPRSPDDDES
jgi:hypothetical protein